MVARTGRFFCLAAIALMLCFGLGEAWWSPDFRWRQRFEVVNPLSYEIRGGAPVPVVLQPGSSAYEHCGLNPHMRFVDEDDTTLLPSECEVYNTTASSIFWVRVPKLFVNVSSNAYSVYMYCAQDTALASYDSLNHDTVSLWKEYNVVYHMGNNTHPILSNSVPWEEKGTGHEAAAALDGIYRKSTETRARDGLPVTVDGIAGPALDLGLQSHKQYPGLTGRLFGYGYYETLPGLPQSLYSFDYFSIQLWVKLRDYFTENGEQEVCTYNEGRNGWSLLSLRHKDFPNRILLEFQLRKTCEGVYIRSGDYDAAPYLKKAGDMEVSFQLYGVYDWLNIAVVVDSATVPGTTRNMLFVNGALVSLLAEDIISRDHLTGLSAENLVLYVGGPDDKYKVCANPARCTSSSSRNRTVIASNIPASLDEVRISTSVLTEQWYNFAYLTQKESLDIKNGEKGKIVMNAESCCAGNVTRSSMLLESNSFDAGRPGTSVTAVVKDDLGKQPSSKACGDAMAVIARFAHIGDSGIVVDVPLGFIEATKSFSATAIIRRRGTYHASLVVDGKENPLSPPEVVEVTSGHVNSDNTQLVGKDRQKVLEPGNTWNVTLMIMDSSGNAPDEDVSIDLVPVAPATRSDFEWHVVTGSDGVVSVFVSPSDSATTGTKSFDITVDGNAVPQSPFSVTVENGSSGNDNNFGAIGIALSVVSSIFGVCICIGCIAFVIVLCGSCPAAVALKKKMKGVSDEEDLIDLGEIAFGQDDDIDMSVPKAVISAVQEVVHSDQSLILELLCESVPAMKSRQIVRASLFSLHLTNTASPKTSFGIGTATFVKNLVQKELKESLRTSTIFRTDSLATRALQMYSLMVGAGYLRSTLRPALVAVEKWAEASDHGVELDPRRMGAGADQDLAHWTLLSFAQRVLVDILASVERCPKEMKWLAREVSVIARDQFPDEGERASSVVLASMFFLRFFCAAVLSPHLFGVIAHEPEPRSQRAYILIAKLMQNLANDVEFGGKEKYMTEMNAFIRKNREKIESFFRGVTNEACESSAISEKHMKDVFGPPTPPKETSMWSYSVISQTLMTNYGAVLDGMAGRGCSSESITLMTSLALKLLPDPPEDSDADRVGLVGVIGSKGVYKERWAVLKGQMLWLTSPSSSQEGAPAAARHTRRSLRRSTPGLGGASGTIIIPLGNVNVIEDAGYSCPRDGYTIIIDSAYVKTTVLSLASPTLCAAWAAALRYSALLHREDDETSEGGRRRSSARSVGRLSVYSIGGRRRSSAGGRRGRKKSVRFDDGSPSDEVPETPNDEWHVYTTDDGVEYYHNPYTNISVWEKPAESERVCYSFYQRAQNLENEDNLQKVLENTDARNLAQTDMESAEHMANPVMGEMQIAGGSVPDPSPRKAAVLSFVPSDDGAPEKDNDNQDSTIFSL